MKLASWLHCFRSGRRRSLRKFTQNPSKSEVLESRLLLTFPADVEFLWPTSGNSVWSYIGHATNPDVFEVYNGHFEDPDGDGFWTERENPEHFDHGFDINQDGDRTGSSDDGASVLSVFPGSVVYTGTGYDGGWGNNVGVEHNYKGITFRSWYSHLGSAPTVQVGEEVDFGSVLGAVGTTGNSDFAHLDFRVTLGQTSRYKGFEVTRSQLSDASYFKGYVLPKSHEFVSADAWRFSEFEKRIQLTPTEDLEAEFFGFDWQTKVDLELRDAGGNVVWSDKSFETEAVGTPTTKLIDFGNSLSDGIYSFHATERDIVRGQPDAGLFPTRLETTGGVRVKVNPETHGQDQINGVETDITRNAFNPNVGRDLENSVGGSFPLVIIVDGQNPRVETPVLSHAAIVPGQQLEIQWRQSDNVEVDHVGLYLYREDGKDNGSRVDLTSIYPTNDHNELGPGALIHRGLANFKWTVPDFAGEFIPGKYNVKIVAFDGAANTAFAHTQQFDVLSGNAINRPSLLDRFALTGAGTTLSVFGSTLLDLITISEGSIEVSHNGTDFPRFEVPSGIDRIVVYGGDGGGLFDFRDSPYPIEFIGGEGPDEFFGSRFNDTAYLLGGDDFARGGEGADDLFSGDGSNDRLHGGAGDDRLDGSSVGTASLTGGAGADTFIVVNDSVIDQTSEDVRTEPSGRTLQRRRDRIDSRIMQLQNSAPPAPEPVRVSAVATPEITEFRIDKNSVFEGESVVFTVRAAEENWARLELFDDANNNGVLDNSEDVIGRFRGRNRDWRGQLGTANLAVGVHNIRARLLPFAGEIAVSSVIQLTVQPEQFLPEPPPLPDHLDIDPDEVLILLPHRNGDGTVRNNNLAGAGQIDIWEITPRTGGGFRFWTEGSTDTAVALYDANGNIIGSPDTDSGPGENGEILVTLAGDTTYFVTVIAEADGGDYDFVFTGRNQTTEGDITLTPVTHVGSATRSFAGNHRLDFHSVFSPPDATLLDVDLQLDAGLEVIVRVADASNNVIGFYSPSDNILQNLPAEPNTLYNITVYGLYGTNGEYTVEADFYPDDPGFPTDLSPTPAVDDWLIPLNDGHLTVPGLSIEDGSEIDFYLVTPTTTGQYIFETTGSLDTRIGIYQRFSASNATLVSFNEDGGNGLNARLAVDLTSGNAYILAARSGNDETGSYSLVTEGPSPAIGVLEPQGREASFTSSTHFIANNTHWQMFEVTVPTFANELDFLLEYRASSNPSFNLNASVRITDENGDVIAFSDNGGEQTDEVINNLAVAPGATLYITVAGEDFTIGDYRLHVDFNPNFPVSTGNEFPVSTNNWHDWPNVGRNATGNAVVVWNAELYIDGFPREEIHALLIGPDGQPVGSEFRVDTSSGFNFSKPVAAVASDSSFVVAWENHVRRFSVNGAALTGEIDFAPAGESPGYQSIAAAPDGSFVVVWSSFSAGDPNGDIYAQRISASGVKTGPQIRVNSVNVDYQSEPDVAFLSNGEWVVTWTSDLNGPTSTEIRSRSYTNGTPVTNESTVNTSLAGFQSMPRIAASTDGHGYAIVWRDAGQFRGQRFTNDHQPVGSEFDVNTTISGTTVFEEPDVAFGADGKFVVSYSISDGDGRGVAVQKFTETGKSGPELILNQLQVADQDTIAIASNSNDKVLTVWRTTANGQSHIRGIEFTIADILEPEITVLDSEGAAADLSVDFGQLATGGDLASHVVTIRNDGNSDLVISGISIQGVDAARFLLVDGSDFTLVGGTSKNLSISFDPDTQGDFEASLAFSHNDISDIASGDVDPNPLSVALLARVVSPQRLEVTVLPSSMAESAGNGAGVVLVTRRNAVSIDQPLTVMLSSDDPTEATVAASAVIPAGELSVVILLDAVDDGLTDGEQIVLLSATADGFLSGQGTVTVRDNDNAPIDITLSANSAVENSIGATIGAVTVTDSDTGDTHTFVVSDNRFEIVNGELKLKASQSLDFEADSSVSLDITARDDGGLEFTKSFTIFVTNVTELTGIDVQSGQTQRSYLKTLDAVFDQSGGLMDLINNNRLQLTRFDLNGLNGSLMGLPARTVVGNNIRFDFGVQGIGGNRNTNVGDGYYELGIDMDGNGSFESKKYFHRLFGDVNGDGIVNSADKAQVLSASGTTSVESDVNGDGLVNIFDTLGVGRAVGRKLKGDLFRDD